MISDTQMTELEAVAFRRLMAHLRARSDVQNIDMMNLAGFCRNCLSNWMMEAAEAKGLAMDKAASRAHVYGMDYDAWRTLNQREASPDQLKDFEKNTPGH